MLTNSFAFRYAIFQELKKILKVMISNDDLRLTL